MSRIACCSVFAHSGCGKAMNNELIAAIKDRWDPASLRSGNLIVRFDIVGHYKVALSDSHAVSWGPKDGGRLKVRRVKLGHADASDVSYLSRPLILANLLASVSAFHHAWPYRVLGFNCEHWARLVVSGEARSYQIAQTWWGFFGLFPGFRRHRGAEGRLKKHLSLLQRDGVITVGPFDTEI